MLLIKVVIALSAWKRGVKSGANSVGDQKMSLLMKGCGGLQRAPVHVHQGGRRVFIVATLS